MVNEADLPRDGRFVGREHRFPLRVYFEDTDVAGIVYYANYLRYMERARSDMMRVVGIDQRGAIEAGAGAFVVAEVNIRYRRPARLDDDLLVLSQVARVRPASTIIHQKVMRESQLLCEAEVTAAFVAPDGRARRQPPGWVRLFEGLSIG